MTSREDLVKLWADALSARTDERMASLGAALADEVRTVSAIGTTEGKEAVLASFGRSPVAAFFAQGSWSEPTFEGDTSTITCMFPPSAPVGGVSVRLTFDSQDRIVLAESTVVAGPPPASTSLELTGAIAEAVNGALLNGTPVVVAHVDPTGRPHLSFRGSTQVFSPRELAIWVRNPEGGLVTAISTNPHLALLYRDPVTRTRYQLEGKGRVDHDEAVREQVYTSSPEPERNLDAGRRGVAVVIDIDRVEGRDGSGPVLMELKPAP